MFVSTATVNISETLFENNSGLVGGAIHSFRKGEIQVFGSTFRSNVARTDYLQDLWQSKDNAPYGPLTTCKTTHTVNSDWTYPSIVNYVDDAGHSCYQRTSLGGALAMHLVSAWEIHDTRFQENSANYGGAIYTYGDGFMETNVDDASNFILDWGSYPTFTSISPTQTTYQQKKSYQLGIMLPQNRSSMIIHSSTFELNVGTSFGGAVFADHAVYEISGTIFGGNIQTQNWSYPPGNWTSWTSSVGLEIGIVADSSSQIHFT